MTTSRNARLAGAAFLLYIIVGVQRAPTPGAAALMTIFTSLCAFVLGVTLYALTRAQDEHVALLALVCRVAEGVLGAMFIPTRLALQSATPELQTFLLAARGWNPIVGATFFAIASLLFSWLMARGRVIPVIIAWLGVIASVILIVALPLQLASVLPGKTVNLLWIPMAIFEVAAALWLLIKGARVSA